MRTAFVTLFFALGVATAGDKAEAEKELQKFQGTWTFDVVEVEGKKVPAADYKEMSVTFDGEKYIVKEGKELLQSGTQKLDPSQSPKTMDVKVAEGPYKGTVILGIYEINGDTLKVCFDPEGKKRPTQFQTTAGSPVTLVVHQRMKK